ncbi:hypothetical protein [Advenella sp. FME57]|uniref:hypothetical protein n=1 Tax=Advenella sp. FME57 TaxID=2742604 RepID=UPI001868100A|nr:hypothetical protein [Advenella sp. FME57]
MKTYLDLIPLMDTPSVARHPGSTKAPDLPGCTHSPMSLPKNAQSATESHVPQVEGLCERTV